MKVKVKTPVQLGDEAHWPGEILDLDPETAKASPWAFEEQDAGSRIKDSGLAPES